MKKITTALRKLDRKKSFSIVYEKEEGKSGTYVCRYGVGEWKGMDGCIHHVQGYNPPLPKGKIRVFCFTRKHYRMFDIAKIKQVKQGKIFFTTLNLQQQ